MKLFKHISVIFATIPLLVLGCTPSSQNLMMKADLIALDGSDSESLFENLAAATTHVQPPRPMKIDWATRNIIRSYGETIRKYSLQYGFDWRLTLAVMKAESSFLDSAVSPVGAEGLMQIMPATQLDVAKALDLESVVEPQANIRAGIYYLSRLYRLFDEAEENDRLRLTLAAYNAGPGRVFDAQDIARYMNEDAMRWASVRDALPLLSSRYYTLHQQVWVGQKPRSGVFSNHRETISYVEKVMNYYDEYRLALN
ncbi:MAG: hypothetical protein C4326_13700 [Ignavibacteria bacterium]